MVFTGCEYECQMCFEVFYYVEDLRNHIKKSHCPPDDYLDKYKKFETKAVFWLCKICKKEIKRNFASICKHLTQDHEGTDITRYQKKHNLSVYKVAKKQTGIKRRASEPEIDMPINNGPSSSTKRLKEDTSISDCKIKMKQPKNSTKKRKKAWYEGRYSIRYKS